MNCPVRTDSFLRRFQYLLKTENMKVTGMHLDLAGISDTRTHTASDIPAGTGFGIALRIASDTRLDIDSESPRYLEEETSLRPVRLLVFRASPRGEGPLFPPRCRGNPARPQILASSPPEEEARQNAA